MVRPLIEELPGLIPAAELFSLLKGGPYPFFLDSASDFGKLGRFSFLGCDPFFVFNSEEKIASNPFLALKEIFGKYNNFAGVKEIPFTSGAVGYFSYDLKDFVEDLPDTSRDDMNLPRCIMGFYDVVIIRDNLKKKTYIASSGLPFTDKKRNLRRQKERIKEFKDKLSRISKKTAAFSLFVNEPRMLRSNFSKAAYIEAIEKAKEYIKKGDIYQVNLSQRFEAELAMEPFDLYSRLRSFSPAPFAAYLDFKDATILSSSPERFLLKRGSYIETRPIKGTRPRGDDPDRDMLLGRELISSPKDNAEHIMIVDLERNDLGRICRYGTVKPTESAILEKYANVFHLVSTVSGRLKSDCGPIDCLCATFPGGSITGAPKIRSMEIIEELEPVKRSIYTGAIGYISFDGNMDTSIVIRTIVIKGKKAYFQVGGGIVADSIPEKEYDETLDKAKGIMKALGIRHCEERSDEAILKRDCFANFVRSQ